jgi:hypothetical protein
MRGSSHDKHTMIESRPVTISLGRSDVSKLKRNVVSGTGGMWWYAYRQRTRWVVRVLWVGCSANQYLGGSTGTERKKTQYLAAYRQCRKR